MSRVVHIRGEAHTHEDFHRALGYAAEWGLQGYPVAYIFLHQDQSVVASYYRSVEAFDAHHRPDFVMVGQVEGNRYCFRS